MSERMGEREAICKALWWPLGLWKGYKNAVHLPFSDESSDPSDFTVSFSRWFSDKLIIMFCSI